MKKWPHPPKKIEIESEILSFFTLLKQGKLDQACERIAHRYDDWEYQIYGLWQDTYLIDLEEQGLEPSDDSFEGKIWLKDLTWLDGIGIDSIFNWDCDADHVDTDGEHLFVNIVFKDEVTDVSGDFFVIKDDHGHFYIEREIIRIL